MQPLRKQLANSSTEAIQKLNIKDPNSHIKSLAKKRSPPQDILDAFNHIKENGTSYDTDTYLIAQKSLIQLHCQQKHVRSAKNVWNALRTDQQYSTKLKLIDYHIVLQCFIDHTYTHTGMEIFFEMCKTLKPDARIYMLAMIAASHLKNLENAIRIHGILTRNAPEILDSNKAVQNSLIDMYLKCGDVNRAQQIFQSMTHKRDADTWNILINGMVCDGRINEAFEMFAEMIKQNIKPDGFTYSSIAKAVDCKEKAHEIYDMIRNDENIDLYSNVVLCNSLTIMFGKAGDIKVGMEIWKSMSEKQTKIDIRTWNAVLNANYYNGNYESVLELYDQLIAAKMNGNGLDLQIKTYHICLKACVELDNLEKAREMFAYIGRQSWMDWKGLIKIYVKYNGIEESIKLWKGTNEKSLREFRFMLYLCVESGENMRAFELFDEMQNVYNLKPDTSIFEVILRACGKHSDLIKAMHKQIIECGPEMYNNKDLVNHLIDAYKKCGETKLAKHVWKVYKDGYRSNTLFG